MINETAPDARSARWRGSALRSARSTGRFLREILRSPQSALGLLIVLFFLLMAVFGPVIAPYSTNDQSSAPRLSPGTDGHLFGTDYLGRDVFSRVVLGASSIFRTAGLGTLIAVILGTFTGLFIGYRGGVVDEIAGRLIDALLALPALLIALVILGVVRNLEFERGSWQAVLVDNSVLLVIALVYVPIVARVVRSSTLEIKSREFVEAAQIRGESSFYIIFREIFPSVVPALVVEASLRFSYAIFLVASLGFLGVAARPPSPDWGLMVNENRGGLFQLTPWALEYPAGAIALLVVGVNLMSDGIRRAVQRSG
ncbi:MAG TPA: ABC transporter permease [Aggregatilinea sp.]|jgi:peptide/nickel transport system permease protein|uniref:ABC transporter permease n=1 Tax=Aggregatilinea sp. TaxID=2806333 RepID=UPI002BBE3D3B|nr:ABC transporter permease [Aggregatilinea sp.]HML24208.1 ABC transporter permease [Aggregatilinea sp.]